MAKKINFDDDDTLNIVNEFNDVIDGVPTVTYTRHSIQRGQLKAHLVMFDKDMAKAHKDKAALVVKAVDDEKRA